jgi:hypothetical protein
MTIERLDKLHHAQPFKAFTIFLGDGRKFHVSHPELLLHPPGTRTFVVWADDAFEIIDLLLVTSLRQENRPRNDRRQSRGKTRG